MAVFGLLAVAICRRLTLNWADVAARKRAAQMHLVTGLQTRIHLVSLLAAKCMQSRQQTAPVSVMLLEVQDLESIAAALGQKAADQAAESVGKILEETINDKPLVGRYGTRLFSSFCLISLPSM